MPPDTIRRSAAKEAIEKAFSAPPINPHLDLRYQEALAALDSLPAAEADGRWETLKKWLPVVAEDWDRDGMPEKKFAVAYILDKMDQIDAVIAAPSPPAAEGAERPPAIIRAKPSKNAGHAWMWRAGSMWVPLQGTYNRMSRELFDVDRESSTSAALALYDNDISNSGPRQASR